ncbi:type II toxin-antitoxin system VapC family toxin [Methanosarcina mazei]|uniref:PIN domain-containing protein n=1 Tax=Methanosarcina mazei LYC TaxID=1434114 RepID=A0A0E3LVP8_METMZ|nr:type II toxin-antitoxin system VapC family toxin [Methanosarcina mazei]AKB67396.1 hypothetical protein MSMAL_0853 [Methanosarcina mazei LYC]
MPILAIDANIPITFVHAGIWDIFEEYVRKCKYSVIMPEEVYDEVRDRSARLKLENAEFVQKIKLKESSFKALKADSISNNKSGQAEIQDNDYRLITLAFDEKADYLVSNDKKLIYVADKYIEIQKQYEKNPLPIVPPELFWLMYSERKDLFGLRKDISTNLKYYRKIEIDRMHKGIKEKGWDCDYCYEIFDIYKEKILSAIDFE